MGGPQLVYVLASQGPGRASERSPRIVCVCLCACMWRGSSEGACNPAWAWPAPPTVLRVANTVTVTHRLTGNSTQSPLQYLYSTLGVAKSGLRKEATDRHSSCVFEVFWGAAPEVLSLLEGWGRAPRAPKRPRASSRRGRLATLCRMGRNFFDSKEAQRGAAIERSLTVWTVRRLTARLLGCVRQAAKPLLGGYVRCLCVHVGDWVDRCPLQYRKDASEKKRRVRGRLNAQSRGEKKQGRRCVSHHKQQHPRRVGHRAESVCVWLALGSRVRLIP